MHWCHRKSNYEMVGLRVQITCGTVKSFFNKQLPDGTFLCGVKVLLWFLTNVSLFCPSGSEMVEAQSQRFEVRSTDGERVLFSADEEEISIGTEKLRVTGRSPTCFFNGAGSVKVATGVFVFYLWLGPSFGSLVPAHGAERVPEDDTLSNVST